MRGSTIFQALRLTRWLGRPLTIFTFYRASWYAMLVVMLLLLTSSKSLPWWFAVSSGAFCALALDPDSFRGRWRGRYPAWLSGAFTVFVLVVTGVHFALVRSPVSLISGTLLAFIPLFLSRRQKAFGHWIALLTASLLALIGVIAGSSFIQYLLFFIFLSGVVLHLNAANLLLLSGPGAARHLTLAPGYFRQLIPSLIAGFAAGVIIFVIFPRSQVFANPFNLQPKAAVTQYTGNVSLNGKPVISESSLLAMLVESESEDWLEKAGPGLYFRGNAHDYFNGTDWSSPARAVWPYSEHSDVRVSTLFQYPPRRIKIFREPHSTTAVIYPNVLFGIQVPHKLMGGLSFDADASLVRGHADVIRYTYEVLAADPSTPREIDSMTLSTLRDEIDQRSPRRPFTTTVTRDRKSALLDVPEAVRNDAVFKQWVGSIGIDRDKSTIGEVFSALRTQFADKFTATLVSEITAGNTLRKFLAEKRGHCEYFATAAALFLRELGVPSRIVLGYRGGTFNQVSRVLEVRERNAHAWVEAYFPRSGWFTFEPTPMGIEPRQTQWELFVEVYVNAGRYWFNRYVINYNSETQRDLVKKFATTAGLSAWRVPRASMLALACLTLALLYGRRRGWARMLFPSFAPRILPPYYLIFLKRLRDVGVERAAGETLARFHRRLGTTGVDRFLLNAIDEAIEADLYSSRPQPMEARQGLMQRLKGFRPPDMRRAEKK